GGTGTTLDAAAGEAVAARVTAPDPGGAPAGAAAADRTGEPWAAVLLGAGKVGGTPATLVGTEFAALHRLYPGWRLAPPGSAEGTTTPPDGTCVLGISLARRAGLSPGDTAVVRAAGGGGSVRAAGGGEGRGARAAARVGARG